MQNDISQPLPVIECPAEAIAEAKKIATSGIPWSHTRVIREAVARSAESKILAILEGGN